VSHLTVLRYYFLGAESAAVDRIATSSRGRRLFMKRDPLEKVYKTVHI